MTVFHTAVDVLFADPNLGVAGTFTAPPAAGVPVRVILARHDPIADFRGMDSRLRAPSWEAIIKRLEVPTRPRVRVDLLTISDPSFGITDMPINDVAEDIEQTVWVCDLGG